MEKKPGQMDHMNERIHEGAREPQAGDERDDAERPRAAVSRRARRASVPRRLVANGRRAPAHGRITEAAPEDNVFRCEGEFWTIAYAGTLFRLKDRVGLFYLAFLLSNPDQEFLALDMLLERWARTPAGEHRAGWPGLAGYPGSLLDARAKAAYRRRLRELRPELEEAETLADMGWAEKVQAEIDFIERELARAVGLGNHDRREGWVERARLSVYRAMKGPKGAVARIATYHPALGRHLDVAVRTGTFCIYLPDPRVPIDWQT